MVSDVLVGGGSGAGLGVHDRRGQPRNLVQQFMFHVMAERVSAASLQ